MKTIINNINITEKDMTKKDVIETIIYVINQILNYTSRLEEITPSIFDEKNKIEKLSEEDLSTDQTLSDSINNLSIEDNHQKKEFILSDYIYYWVEILNFDENLLLLMMMNLDKILNSKMIILNEQNVQNVLFTCMIITQKYYDDVIFNDKDYCKMKNLELDELIEMQEKELEMLNFSLYISEDDFKEYKKRMKKLWKKNMLYLCYS